jgi:hypothetical protein
VNLAKKINNDLAKYNRIEPVLRGNRVDYIFIKTDNNHEPLYLKAEDPQYAKENGLELDIPLYIERQLANPVTTLFEDTGMDVQVKQALEGALIALRSLEYYKRRKNILKPKPPPPQHIEMPKLNNALMDYWCTRPHYRNWNPDMYRIGEKGKVIKFSEYNRPHRWGWTMEN